MKIHNIENFREKNFFDIATSFDVLEHVPNPVELTSRMINSLKRGGILIMAVDFYNITIEEKGPEVWKGIEAGAGTKAGTGTKAGIGTKAETGKTAREEQILSQKNTFTDTDYHLPENFPYGGLLQTSIEKVGMKKIYGLPNPFMETALASLSIYVKDENVPEDITPHLKEQMLKLLRKFKGYFEKQIKLVENI